MFQFERWRLELNVSLPGSGERCRYAAQNIQNMIDASSTTLWWVELGLGVLALAAAIWFAAELGRSASGAENTVRLVATSGVFLFSVLGVSVINQMTENTD